MAQLSEQSQNIYQRLKDDFEFYARNCLVIRPKDPKLGGEVKFTLNKAQQYIHEKIEEQKKKTGKVRAIICKSRQQGCSTYIQARFFWLITHRRGVRGFILAHEESATKNLFEMSKRFYDNCFPQFRPALKASNAQEMSFSSLDSGYKLGTASNKSVGRSSTIQYLHASESAFWANADDHSKGIMQAVPDSGDTEIIIESTANGMGNYYHEMWQKAESGDSDFIPIFVPWYWQDEYVSEVPESFSRSEQEDILTAIYELSDEQVMWRRKKIAELSVAGQDGERSFKQEYPFTSIDAFQLTGESAFLSPELVMQARKSECEPYGPLIIGVDPAGMGRDRTAIIRRRGRVASGIQVYKKKDTMELAGILHMIILKEKPHKMFIDSGAMGPGIIDRLKELGHANIVTGVNSASSALDSDKYANKRAEMWGMLSEWLMDYPCKIPDDDELHADLCGIKAKSDSKGRLLMERKEDMAKRRVRSPDLADALALTFSEPESAIVAAQASKTNEAAKMFADHLRHKQRLKKEAWK